MQIAGIVLAVVGIGLAARSALLLAGRGRPRRGPRPAFVIAGPYRRVRNPLLGGLVLALLGVVVAMRSGWLAMTVPLVLAAAHVWVVRIEEPRLRERFGTAYAEYLRHVPRWIPRA